MFEELTQEEKLIQILESGGSVILHKNDLERLKEAHLSKQSLPLFSTVKIYPDHLGILKEGQALALLPGFEGARLPFSFDQTLKNPSTN